MKEAADKQTKAANAPETGQGASQGTPPHAQQTGAKSSEQRSPQQSASKQPNGERQSQQRGMPRRDWFAPATGREHPFAMMRRFSNDMDRFMDRMLEDFGFGRGWFGASGRGQESNQGLWSPQVEVYERDNQLCVCADLPGLKKDDIHVEFTDDALIVQGERRQESEDTQQGYHRSERSYGSFYRNIPLPEGINPENAKATFQDGVLKITLPLPQQEQSRSRRIQVEGAEEQSQVSQAIMGQSASSQSAT